MDNDDAGTLRRLLDGVIRKGKSGSGSTSRWLLADQDGNIIGEGTDENEADGGGDGVFGGGGDGGGDDKLAKLQNFELKPKEVRDHLNRYVVKQDEAKKLLSVAICDHYNHVRRLLTEGESADEDYSKPNILLTGPTGVGKSYLMKNIARLIGVPFVKADATKFSETGIVGKDADDLVRELHEASGGNATLAQFGIIYVDEIDKIANGGGGDDAYRGARGLGGIGTGVQNNLLKLLEETDVSLENPRMMGLPAGLLGGGGGGPKTISTKNILFIFSGAFTRLDADIKKRMETKGSFGFELGAGEASAAAAGSGEAEAEASRSDSGELAEGERSALRYAETADFVGAGLEPEFIGRVPVRVALDSLGEADLLQILTGAEGSVLKQFVRDFSGYNITMHAAPDGLSQVARLAAGEKTGARGLVTILERVTRDFKFELPSSSVSSFVLDNATISDPAAALERLLALQTAEEQAAARLDDLKRYERSLQRQLEPLQVWFTDEAIDVVLQAAHSEGVSAYSYAAVRFEALPGAVERVAHITGQTMLPISASMARDPDAEIKQWLALIEPPKAHSS